MRQRCDVTIVDVKFVLWRHHKSVIWTCVSITLLSCYMQYVLLLHL